MSPKSLAQRFPTGLDIAHFEIGTGIRMQPGCPNSLSVPAIISALPQQAKTCAGKIAPVTQPKATPAKKKPWWLRIFS